MLQRKFQKLNYTDSTLYDELLENEIFVKNFKSKIKWFWECYQTYQIDKKWL